MRVILGDFMRVSDYYEMLINGVGFDTTACPLEYQEIINEFRKYEGSTLGCAEITKRINASIEGTVQRKQVKCLQDVYRKFRVKNGSLEFLFTQTENTRLRKLKKRSKWMATFF